MGVVASLVPLLAPALVPSVRPHQLVLVAVLLAVAVALAQEPIVHVRERGPLRFVAAPDLARALGAPLVSGPAGLTLRADTGILTLFAGAPDALWQGRGAAAPLELASFAPPLLEDDVWYVPEDLLEVLGVRILADVALLPDGRSWPLRFAADAPLGDGSYEVLELAPAVPALRIYADVEPGDQALSLLAVDLGMLALAFPEQRAAFDAELRGLGGEKALFLAVSSLVPTAFEPVIAVRQGGVEVLLRPPLELQVLDGDPADVGPGSPVAAAAFIPAGFDLRQPLSVRFRGVSGSITLRR